MTNPTSRALNFIARGSLCVLAFLVPLVAFPWTTDMLDFNKYLVLVLFVTVGALSWVGSMVAERSVNLKTHWSFLVPILFVLITALASAFSLAPYTSWLGEGSQEYTSFLTAVLLAVLFVLGGHLFSDMSVRRGTVAAMFFASGVIGLFVILSFLGIRFEILSNPIGVPSTLALYFLVMAIFGSGVLLSEEEGREGQIPLGPVGMLVRAAVIVTNLAALLLLISIDSQYLWVLTFIGLLPLFAFILALPREFGKPLHFVFPLLFLVAAFLFVLLPPVIKNTYPLEIGPKMSTTANITGSAWSERSWILGTGPGTFAINYTKYAPLSVNDSVFWDTRFDRGSSQFLTLLTTHGVLGTLVYLSFILAVLLLSLDYLSRSRAHGGWRMMYGPFAAWLVLASATFLLTSNMTIQVLFMLLSALLIAQIVPVSREVAFARSPRLALVSAFLFMLLGVGMLMVLFVSLSRYSAETAFAKAAALDKAGAPTDEIIPLLNKAATRNRWSDKYYRNLGNILLIKTAELSQREGVTPEEMKAYVASAVNAGMQATNLAPYTVMNWDFRGQLYRELSTVMQNANDFSIQAYQKAVELAPTNPKYLVGLARAFIVRADLLATLIAGEDEELAEQAKGVRDEALEKASAALQKAIELKGDYTPARYYLAFVEERQGNLAEAVRSMEIVKATSPNDVGVGIQLALLYMRQGKNDLAKAELERILTLAPTYANAHWYLSSVYEKEGEMEKAIAELEKIIEIDPESAEKIEPRLERLRNGVTAPPAEIPEPIDDGTETSMETTPEESPTTP